MNVTVIVGVAIVCATIIVLLRKHSKEFAVPASVIASILILSISLVFATDVFNKIEEIDVNIKNTKTKNLKKEEELTDSEIRSIKEYLNNIYSIEEERIHINE